jgi:UDP-glucose 4-epimerase
VIVLVTGGAGFIGANLCRRLVGTPEVRRVRVLDDLSTGRKANLAGLDVDLIEGSIMDRATLRDAVDGCDSIVHLAAVPSVPRSIVDPVRSHEVNATGTLFVLEAARAAGGTHIVLSSSSSVYGANNAIPKSERLAPMPVSPYAVSKLAAESYAVSYAQCFGMRVLPFRLFNVFGPLQAANHAYAAVVPTFIDAALSGRPLPINGDGLQSRDFTYIETVIAILSDAVVRRLASAPTNLAFGTRTNLIEVIQTLEGILGTQLVREHRGSRPGDVRHSQADNSRLCELFPGVVPTALAVGIRHTVEWFRAQGGQRTE